jgi:hypothetical protein
VFAAILDADHGGLFRISPDCDGWSSKQLYLPDTNVLITRFLMLGRAEQRAVRGERDLVAGAPVVEARDDVDDEAHLPAHGEYPADQPVRRLAGTRRDHEILHLPHSIALPEELGGARNWD